MSTDGKLWLNDGTPENRRFPNALDPDYFRIDDRTPADYLHVLAAMAKKLRLDESRSWQKLLPEAPSPDENRVEEWRPILAKIESRRDNPPHLALFITFLRLYRHAQDQLNSLTGAHLDHYYRQVLGFRRHPAKPDHLCVFPSLAKGVTRHLLPTGTALDAGQDAEGNPLIYMTESEIVVTQARVASVKAIHVAAVADAGNPWLRVSPVADSMNRLGAPAFGPPPALDSNKEEHLGFGFAISSPILFLKEGNRTIKLTVGASKKIDWKAYLSIAKGWLAAAVTTDVENVVTIALDAKAPAIVAVDPKVHTDAPLTNWPVLKLYPPAGISSDDYKEVMAATIASLAVTVDRVTSLKLSNDLGPLDPANPFQPFGPRPILGSSFSFESEELKAKSATLSKLYFEWLGKDKMDVEPKKPDLNGKLSEFALFSDKDVSNKDGTATLSATAITLAGPKPDAFGHATYPTRVSDVATANAAAIATAPKTDSKVNTTPFPPEPYTPTLKSFAIGYTAEQAITDADIRLFHLHPFGIEQVKSSARLLPAWPDASSLFIGIADFDPGSPLHLHFAAIEGSGKRLQEGQQPPPIAWSYLPADGWKNFPADAVEDGTGGLMQPGIISFESMPDAVDSNPQMPPGLHWIRASVKQNPDAVCKLSGITAQTVRATLQRGDTVPVHLRAGSRDVLPADSVKNLLVPDPAIASVAQPYTSYGGREAEDERGFYTRVSERLRHRQRAVTAWDYERLVLEAFPEIYKVLCVRSSPGERLGEVKIVVVPRSVRASWYDPLQPRPAPALKREIQEYLRGLSSGMATVSVIDPDYEPLRVTCTVTFTKGKSATVCKARLVEDLKRFLTPWAYDHSKEIVFGGRIHQSIIQTFIDQRDYVEHFTGFKLVKNPSVAIKRVAEDPPVTEAKATNPWSILVSARDHDIRT